MTWFYTGMVQWHVLLAWCSASLFFVRGAMFQFGSPRVQELAKDTRLLVLVFGVNSCLVVSGLSLWGVLGYHPIRNGWLGIKLLALVGYAVCGHWAMTQAKLHLLGYLTALALLALAMDLSFSRSFLGLA
ncbi:SirB2 family protein [Roseateles sp. DC23W]|uniref:SirB2 family protein n=1 Tax=Pelomonas dachongensis TaxID=3299029 RepID=A0ABW7ENK4_9BURK